MNLLQRALAVIIIGLLLVRPGYSQTRPGDLTRTIQELSRQEPERATPELLKLYSSLGEDYHRGDILDVLGRLWAIPRERMNYRHPLPRAKPVPPEVIAAVLEGFKAANPQIAAGASRAAYLIKIDEAIPLIERLGRDGNAHLASESLRNFDSVEAGRAILRLLQVSYSDEAAYGYLISALPKEPIPEAVPILTSLLDNKHDTRFNGLRVCDWAADALSRYLPDGPGYSKPRFAREDQYEEDRLMDYLIDSWKAYLRNSTQRSPESARELARRLYQLADEWMDGPFSIMPPSGIRWARQIESSGVARGNITADNLRALKTKLTAQEIQLYTKLIGFPIKRGGTPPETPWTPNRYPDSERTRFDGSNRLLDLWGHPYVYIAAPSSGKPFVIYSRGPNGIDNGGEGDDIASWKLDTSQTPSTSREADARPRPIRRIDITPQSSMEILLNALLKGSSNDRLSVMQLHRGCMERNPEIRTGIVAALSDPSPTVRGRAAGCCGAQFIRADAPEIIPTLREMLKEKAPEPRAGAMSALRSFHWLDFTDDALNALRDDHPSVRLEGAMYMSGRPSRKTVIPLISALKDSDPQVRKWAAQSLGMTRDPQGLEPLRALLADPNEQVREYAKNAIRWIEPRQ